MARLGLGKKSRLSEGLMTGVSGGCQPYQVLAPIDRARGLESYSPCMKTGT